jgi:PAS domain S-box-containing protein
MKKSLRAKIPSRVSRASARLRIKPAGASFGSEPFAQATIDSLRAHICVLDDAGVILAVNRAWRDFARANGLQPSKVASGLDYLAVCDAATGPDAGIAAAFADGIRAVMKGERAEFSLEYPCHSPTEQRWFIGEVTGFANKGLRLVVAHENITERKLAEEALRESEDRHRSLISTSMDAVLLTVPDGRILAANEAACRMFGRSEQELIRVGRKAVVDVSDPRLAHALAERARTGRFCSELTLIRKDGTRFPGEVSSAIFTNRHGEQRTSMVIRDISEQKRLEAAVRKSEEKFRTVADFSCGWETWIAPDGKYIYVSPWCERITGYRAEEFMADPKLLARIAHPDDRSQIHSHFRQYTRGPVREIVFRLITRGGEERWVEHICQPVHGPGGVFQGRRVSTRDITDRKRAEKALDASREQLRALAGYLQSVREEERSRIAREIHDQLAQDLTRLKMDILWLRRSLPHSAGGEGHSLLRTKLSAVTGATDSLIGSVQKIATELRPAVLDSMGLGATIEWQAREFRKRTGIRCDTKISEELPTIPRDWSTALFRILQESLTNVTRHAAATTVAISLESDHARITMRIRDNGRGIRADRLADSRSFGLLGMRERAMALGGECKIVTRAPRGTTIEVCIPLSQRGIRSQT